MTMKVQILQTLRRLFIILVGLTMTWFSEKMLIFNIYRRGLMPNLIKKSWTVSMLDSLVHWIMWHVVICNPTKKTLVSQLNSFRITSPHKHPNFHSSRKVCHSSSSFKKLPLYSGAVSLVEFQVTTPKISEIFAWKLIIWQGFLLIFESVEWW